MISVVMPAYNVENYIAESIQSVLNQTYEDWELIVVNDGSTDNTEKVIRSFSDARIRLINQENQGVSVARNVGIDNAKGDYICFLDSDDLYKPEFLELMINNIQGDFIYCGFYLFEESGKTVHPIKNYATGNILYEVTQRITNLHINSVLFKRSILMELGMKFVPGCAVGEDTEFVYKFLCTYNDVECVPKELYCYRTTRPDSITNSNRSYYKKKNKMESLQRLLEFIKHNYRGKHYDEVVSKISSNLDYVVYRAVLTSIREKKYEDATKLLNENNINLHTRTFSQKLKWKLINTRNKFIWKLV